jgi:hypothetical protein
LLYIKFNKNTPITIERHMGFLPSESFVELMMKDFWKNRNIFIKILYCASCWRHYDLELAKREAFRLSMDCCLLFVVTCTTYHHNAAHSHPQVVAREYSGADL